MEETLIALLLASTAVVAEAGQRIRLGRADQKDRRPYVVLQKISSLPNYHLQGASGYVAARVQIDCYAETYTEVTTLARAVKGTLSGHSGGNFQAVFIDSERDLPAADAGNVSNLFRTSIDITVHYGEPS
jgi:hypothetical protein